MEEQKILFQEIQLKGTLLYNQPTNDIKETI